MATTKRITTAVLASIALATSLGACSQSKTEASGTAQPQVNNQKSEASATPAGPSYIKNSKLDVTGVTKENASEACEWLLGKASTSAKGHIGDQAPKDAESKQIDGSQVKGFSPSEINDLLNVAPSADLKWTGETNSDPNHPLLQCGINTMNTDYIMTPLIEVIGNPENTSDEQFAVDETFPESGLAHARVGETTMVTGSIENMNNFIPLPTAQTKKRLDEKKAASHVYPFDPQPSINAYRANAEAMKKNMQPLVNLAASRVLAN